MARTALILGVTGQDGAYLARLLLEKNYVVFGSSRDAELARLDGLNALGIRDRVNLISISPTDFRSVADAIQRVAPDEIYNLSGQSSVALSFTQPIETIESVVLGTLNILEALRETGEKVRFYNAGSSEIFGDTGEKPADEATAFRPKSPYGVAKAASVSLVANYRESYGQFACSGILFNHESPLRPPRFVTRKITSAAVRIARGSNERLSLGNLSLRRDFGWAPCYVEAMWSMLNLDQPSDFVIASGISHSLEQFAAAAFAELHLNWRDHVDFDPSLSRPSDIDCSAGNAGRAHRLLGWKPKVGFSELVSRMVKSEYESFPAQP